MNIELAFAKLQFGAAQRIRMYRKISAYIKQGVPLFDTLTKFEKEYGRKKGDPRALILNEWIRTIEEGGTFSDALEKYSTPAEVMIIEAGESAGNIDDALNQAVFVTESNKRIISTIVSGTAYSFVVLLLLIGMIIMFSYQVIPEMEALIPVEKWPDASKSLWRMSDLFKNYWIMGGVLMVFLTWLSFFIMPRVTGRMRDVLDFFPPWSIYKMMQSSVFLIALSSLMKTGVSLNDALVKLKDKSSSYVNHFIDKMMNNLAMGATPGNCMDVNFFDKDVAVDIRLLGDTADFDDVMDFIGHESVEDNLEKIKAKTALIGNLILFFTAGYIGFTYYAFYSLTSSLQDLVN